MQTKQAAVLESLRAVQSFLDDNAEHLADVVNTGARRKLDDALAELETHATDQTASNLAARGVTRKKRILQRKLRRNHMTPIARIARAELPVAPEVEPLKMPKGRPTAERLAAHAEGMAKAAAPLADTFVSAGLPPDFIARLNAASGALVEAVNERTQHRGRQNGATTGLKRRLSSARRLVHVLDAFVQTALEGDETLLANWDIVKRVRRTTNQPLPPVTPIASASVQT